MGQQGGRTGLGGGGMKPRSSGQPGGSTPCAPIAPVVSPAAAGSDCIGDDGVPAVLSPDGSSSALTVS